MSNTGSKMFASASKRVLVHIYHTNKNGFDLHENPQVFFIWMVEHKDLL